MNSNIEMTTEIELQQLFYNVFIYYFKNNRNETREEEIEKYSYFLVQINTYLLNIQKNKNKFTLTDLYNQWTLDQLHIRNYIVDIINVYYIPKINSLETFSYYYKLFYNNLHSFMRIFTPFEKTLEYYASILDRATLNLEQLVKYQWEFSFTQEQLTEIANKEIDNFPSISYHIPVFVNTISAETFKQQYISGIDTKIRELIRNKYNNLNNVSREDMIITKIEFIWDTYQLFEYDLSLYKQYFYKDYTKLYESFGKEIARKKYNEEYELNLSIFDEFFTIQWWNVNNKRIQEKWISISKIHENDLNWDFISIQYYDLLNKHFYYKTHTLTREITQTDYLNFIENITIDIFPFNHKLPLSILNYFYSCINRFIINYWKEKGDELFFIYLSILRDKPVILNQHLHTMKHIIQTFKDDFSIDIFLTKYDALFQKRILYLSYKISDINYPLLHYLEFERNMINEIESLPNANTWFNHKSRWTKMLHEIQESDQFTNTISVIDNSLIPTNIFIGTYGFYSNIDKTFGIKEDHYLFADWKQIESFYPILHEKRNIQLLYNLSTVEIVIDEVTLICSMDVANVIMKWQEKWDENKDIIIESSFDTKLTEILLEHNILQKNENSLEISNNNSDTKTVELLLYKNEEGIIEKKENINIHIFDEIQYYQCAIMRYCKKEETVSCEQLWNYISNYITKIGIQEPDREVYTNALDKLIDSEYISKSDDDTFSYV